MTVHLEHEIEVQPAFYEIDPMQVVWHGHYVKFLERARDSLLRQFDLGYEEMFRCGHFFPVIELFIRYAQPLRLGQRVSVKAKIVEWESRLKTQYELRDAQSGRRLTRAHTVQVAVSASSGEMSYLLPSYVWERLKVPPPA